MTRTVHTSDGTTTYTVDLMSDRGKLDAVADVLEACHKYAAIVCDTASRRFNADGDILEERVRLSRFARNMEYLTGIAGAIASGRATDHSAPLIVARCTGVPDMVDDVMNDPEADPEHMADRLGEYILYGVWSGVENIC